MATKQANLRARRYAPQIGFELTQLFPDNIPELYRTSHTIIEIIYLLKIQGLYPHAALKTLINAVNYALKGYDGQDLAAGDIRFHGLMNPEEVKQIHKTLILANIARIAGRRWIKEEQHWSQPEIQFLMSLSETPKYMRATKRKNSRANYAEIAREVNTTFHDGKPTRTSESVRIMIHRNQKPTS